MILRLILSFLILIFPLPLRAADPIEETTSEEIQEKQLDNNEESNKETELLKGHISKVPMGTKLKIIVETPIDEETSRVDDEFTARTAENILVEGNVVVPAGSTVNGKITEVNTARRLHKAGSVRIEFQNLTTPDGRQIPIVASVLTRSGLLKGKLTKKAALINTATVAAPVAIGAGVGLAASEGSALGPLVGAALGAIAGIGLFFFRKGNIVDIKAGDDLNIELTEEALVPTDLEVLDNKEEASDSSLEESTNSTQNEINFDETQNQEASEGFSVNEKPERRKE